MRVALDTNAIIYLQKGLWSDDPPSGESLISVITEIELFSFPGLTNEQQAWLRRFIDNMNVVGIDEEIKQRAIALRRDHRLKLPDAIIAATTIRFDAVLYSNDKRFVGLPSLQHHGLTLRGETA
uniref:PIN domain-containing protein n=1 Tax=Candidatus Kentrum eta TaxID=2126337 RepID=A0A450ULR3_9GAMM|nr:MAG: hypothetical protein BECKH772A_GA0070896_100574 [Candidatus Kentron sp. H]VFJ94298.1 MAG: hypothetical protein BECKH772B_GA0070898_100593 [Candidatus Kentron sp. H]VFK00909.1 MAG: hypothetical protein BECKH772C_GA0070978_100554 [Candidatus Kentron sp. H]